MWLKIEELVQTAGFGLWLHLQWCHFVAFLLRHRQVSYQGDMLRGEALPSRLTWNHRILEDPSPFKSHFPVRLHVQKGGRVSNATGVAVCGSLRGLVPDPAESQSRRQCGRPARADGLVLCAGSLGTWNVWVGTGPMVLILFLGSSSQNSQGLCPWNLPIR